MLEVNDYLKIFIGILAILNPLGALPMYLSLTQHHSEQEKKAVALTAAKGATIILLVTLFFGEFILGFFGISVNSFRVGGGILILLMAISMLHAQTSGAKNTEAERLEAAKRRVRCHSATGDANVGWPRRHQFDYFICEQSGRLATLPDCFSRNYAGWYNSGHSDAVIR